STTFPRNPACVSGGELSHSVAPLREGSTPSSLLVSAAHAICCTADPMTPRRATPSAAAEDLMNWRRSSLIGSGIRATPHSHSTLYSSLPPPASRLPPPASRLPPPASRLPPPASRLSTRPHPRSPSRSFADLPAARCDRCRSALGANICR